MLRCYQFPVEAVKVTTVLGRGSGVQLLLKGNYGQTMTETVMPNGSGGDG